MKEAHTSALSWRPVETDSDWDSAAALYSCDVDGIQWPGSELRTDFSTLPAETPRILLLGSLDGEDVVYARSHGQHWYSEGSFSVRVSTRPDEEALARAGIERLLQWEPLRAGTRWETLARSDRAARLATWMSFGFQIKMVCPESRIDLQAIDVDRFSALTRALEREGLTLTTQEDWHADERPERFRARYDFEMEVVTDIPLPEPIVPEPYPVWMESTLEDRRHWGRCWLVIQDERPVATTQFYLPHEGAQTIQTGLTAVARSHRRLGLASALKAHALLWARDRGIRYVTTDNADTNPMYRLNQELGFRRVYDNLVLGAVPGGIQSGSAVT
ncbi:MAG: GNAT family N-acetyltransferase [Fimbriimonadaceae bacterium]|nr:GNAT family N-acetyltransferase [Fimbriimonadaceae bacterium]